MATVQLRTRIDADLKRKSDAILKNLGMDAGVYVSMALAQLVHRRGVPFAVTESDEAYFLAEYGLDKGQSKRVGVRLRREAATARKQGKLVEVTGPDSLVL